MKSLFTSHLAIAIATLLATSCGKEEVHAQTTSQNMTEINIVIDGKTFAAEVEDTETGRAFISRLPMTLDMSELNGNEKYYYLSESLPTNAQHYGTIEAGDLMLYGNTCVVLFYGKAGGYSYTRLGKLKQTDGLASAVGRGSVSVTFEVAATGINEISDSSRQTGKVYALNGTVLNQEPSKGVFIKDGKKIVR